LIVAICSLQGCIRIGKQSKEELIQEMKEGNFREARLAALRLKKHGPSVVPDLLKLLEIDEGHARTCARQLIVEFGAEALDPLQAAIESCSPSVRWEIASILTSIIMENPTNPTDPRIMAMLGRIAQEKDLAMRAVMGAYFECPFDDIVQVLPTVCEARQSSDAITAIQAAATELKVVDSDAAVDLLVRFTRSNDIGERYPALRVVRLLKQRAKPLVPHLLSLLADHTYPDRVEVLYTLFQFGNIDPTVKEAIERARSDPDERVRNAANR
jgi:HEAT repeat protein